MAKRLFFSFHYQNDIWRVNQVRNSWVTQEDRESAGYFDASLWEESKRKGDLAIKRMIDQGLAGTSATAVLVGSHTCYRRWVRYEIVRSFEKGNKLLSIHINQLKDMKGSLGIKGLSPFAFLAAKFSADGEDVSMFEWNGSQWVEFIDYPAFKYKSRQSVWGQMIQLSKFFPEYDWVSNDGYTKLGDWIA